MSNAAVWVVDEAHRAEREVSQARFHGLMPDVDVVTLKPASAHPGWYANYIQALIDGMWGGTRKYQRVIVFDSDTWLCEPIPDVYDVLGRFDIAGAHAPARWTCETPRPIPDAFPELNTGVLGFNVNDYVLSLFQYWLHVLLVHYDVWGDNDQGALRAALWERPATIWIMPPEYNCRFGFGGFAGSPVKVLHGRGYPIDRANAIVNAGAGMRVWRNEDFK